jgi:TonB-like protein
MPNNAAATRMSLFVIERPVAALSSRLRAPFTESGALRLFVRGESFFTNLRDSLAVLATRTGLPPSPHSSYFLRRASITRVHFPGGPLSASFVFHCLFLALLGYLPQLVPARTSAYKAALSREERIYYRVPLLDRARVPRLAPLGLGGRPGSGSVPTHLPALGSTAHRPNMTIISKPIHPDNLRQTIYQPSSPPDLKITTEQKLPITVSLPQLKAPKASFNPELAKPKRNLRQVSAATPPSVDANPVSPLSTSLKPLDTQPRLAIPLAGGGWRLQQPKGASGGGSGASSAEAGDLMAVGVDPASPTDQIALPGGNRWGEFSLTPNGGAPGSPGGGANGIAGGGPGSGGPGGDGSTGMGSGGSGGGGGNNGTAVPVMIAGIDASSGSAGMLGPPPPISLVFPVTVTAERARRSALTVSAGPIGGGGLNVYHALACGNIYSIFLPMPGKNWSLQYCAKSINTRRSTSEVPAATIHLEKPLVAPDADLSQRFDFKRVPVPVEVSHRTIVLKGVIAIDGTIQHLVVHQGVAPEMDEAARLAFSRWHFKPAMRDGKPIEVEILVGIPPSSGEDRVNR